MPVSSCLSRRATWRPCSCGMSFILPAACGLAVPPPPSRKRRGKPPRRCYNDLRVPPPTAMSPPMSQRQTADLPLHSGSAPAWLFRRMVDLAGAIATLIVRDGGPVEMLRRLSDPFWFQAFGCVLGFDWHSSGVTTTVCGALKEAARRCGSDLGIVVCGGKGATSRRTPLDIRQACDRTGSQGDTLT